MWHILICGNEKEVIMKKKISTMSLCKGEEKKLAVLMSIIDIGGTGTKKNVLDNLQDKKYINLTKEDFKLRDIGESSVEPIWRNDLAFVRFELVKEGYVSNAKHNNWKISENGKLYFSNTAKCRLENLELIDRLAKEKKVNFILTRKFYENVESSVIKLGKI
jgi:hypothetical protein